MNRDDLPDTPDEQRHGAPEDRPVDGPGDRAELRETRVMPAIDLDAMGLHDDLDEPRPRRLSTTVVIGIAVMFVVLVLVVWLAVGI